MPLEGRFLPRGHATAAPYLPGVIAFPRLGITNDLVFLIDTGASATSLHPWDISRLGLDYRQLNPASLTYAAGVGGGLGYYREPAVLLFMEPAGAPRFCELEIRICEPTDQPASRELPALLGRDFLNRCSLLLDSSQNLVRLEPLNLSDLFIQPVAPA